MWSELRRGSSVTLPTAFLGSLREGTVLAKRSLFNWWTRVAFQFQNPLQVGGRLALWILLALNFLEGVPVCQHPLYSFKGNKYQIIIQFKFLLIQFEACPIWCFKLGWYIKTRLNGIVSWGVCRKNWKQYRVSSCKPAALPGSSLEAATEHEHYWESPEEENPESECGEADDPCVEPEEWFVYNLVLLSCQLTNLQNWPF